MKKIHATSLAAAVLISLSVTPAYSAQLVEADDPQAILEIAKGYGRAKLITDQDGDPQIVGRMKGTKYTVYFYGCENGRNCDDILFTAGWSGHRVSMGDINDWNRNKRYGKAYLDDENDPILELAVNLKYGVTSRNLDDTFDWWGVSLEGFEEGVLGE